MEDKARMMRDLALASGILQHCMAHLDMITELFGPTYLPRDLVEATRVSINDLRSARILANDHFINLGKSEDQKEGT